MSRPVGCKWSQCDHVDDRSNLLFLADLIYLGNKKRIPLFADFYPAVFKFHAVTKFIIFKEINGRGRKTNTYLYIDTNLWGLLQFSSQKKA